ncbi:MAG: primosome assembly protein PriA [Propionibacteriaceae bacterium]|jgi:primosomal protein N' (replication factor Y)|nr:primosome assembly protein PriA [Propionibacteriaceae bacterium]
MAIRVAKVVVDTPLSHLDREFDYEVPDGVEVVVGCRVQVPFAGKQRSGFVLGIEDEDEPRDGLLPLQRVVSDEPVLAPQIAQLCRKVADHYAGTLQDVLRFAVPPRHAAVEKAKSAVKEPELGQAARVLLDEPGGAEFLAALEAGGRPRAAWTLVPVFQPEVPWATGMLEAAAASLASGRGALLLVPDNLALTVLAAAAKQRFGVGSFVMLSAEQGPSPRYRAFLAAERGVARLVLGTESAVYAPIKDLGLIAMVDDGNDSYANERTPYPHVREVAALRAWQEQAAMLCCGYSRTAEVARLVATGWLTSIGHPAATMRQLGPKPQTSINDFAEKVDFTTGWRLPHEVFEVIRTGLASGPVLIQVPRRESSLGVSQTALELGKAFPGHKVMVSSATKHLDEVPHEPALVMATPGAEPTAYVGYSATVILDVTYTLMRPDLRVDEESLRRWLKVAALTRPAADGGTVLLVGNPSERAIQGFMRLDPVGFAERELADRTAAQLPPAVRLAQLTGRESALLDALGMLELPPSATVRGPWPLPLEEHGPPLSRAVVTASLPDGAALSTAMKTMLAMRSARKLPDYVKVEIDPIAV